MEDGPARPIKSKVEKNHRLYHVADVERVKFNVAEPVDRFPDDGEWWIWKPIASKEFNIEEATLDCFHGQGVPFWRTPNGKVRKIRRRDVLVKKEGGDQAGWRSYFAEEDLKLVKAAREQREARLAWATYYEADNDYGWKRLYLWRWSNEVHPILGRKIATRDFQAASGNKTVKLHCFLRRDLEELAELAQTGVPRPGWVSAPQAEAEGFGVAALTTWHEKGCPALDGEKLDMEHFPAFRRTGNVQENVRHFRRDQLDLVKSNLPERPENRQQYVDAEGTWHFRREAAKIAGVHTFKLHEWMRRPNATLGRVIRSQIVPVTLFRSKHEGAVVYHEADLRRSLARTTASKPRTSKTKPALPQTRWIKRGETAA